MTEDTTDRTDLIADFDIESVLEEATDAFLDDWSEGREVDPDATAAPPIVRSARSASGSGLFDIDEVLETASSVILEILDGELAELETGQFEDETLHALKGALSPNLQSSGADETPKAESTEEIELLDEEIGDPFDATGMQFVDVDTGRRVDDAVPYLDTSFFELVDEDSAPVSTESVIRNLGIRLKNVDEQLSLPLPWSRFLPELRDEIIAEPDMRRRAAYLFIFGQIVRALGSPDAMTDSLQDLAPVAGAVTRSGLLDRLATRWKQPDEEFFNVLRRLERLDDHDEGTVASVRRASIAMERLMDGGLDDGVRARLREALLPPETFEGLVVHAVDSHAIRDRAAAVESWERVGHFASGELASASIALVAWLLQNSPGFFDTADLLLGEGASTRPLLFTMQREAVRTGDRLREARVLKRLIGWDVRFGKRSEGEGTGRTRLKQETASRLVRLSGLLSGLTNTDLEGTELEGMEPYRVMRDAISLNAKSLHYLRRLERQALAAGDLEMVEKSLVSQAATVQDEQLRAVLWDRVADVVRLRGGGYQQVRENLQRSLEADPDCLPALISSGQYMIAERDLEAMLAIRGHDESDAARSAWRRAELLERTGGDAQEILRLYRSSRDRNPDSVHLFFSVERALARLADWRALRTLYDGALDPDGPLGSELPGSGIEVERVRLALEVFLEDSYDDLSDAILRYMDDVPVGDITAETAVDQNVVWRVLAHEMDANPGRAVGRLQVLLQLSRGEETPWRTRALTWYARYLEEHEGSEERLLATHRQIFQRARGVFLLRWAVRGLLRTGDAAWVADNLVAGQGEAWIERGADADHYTHRLAAELHCLSANAGRALDVLESQSFEDEIARAEVAERATVQAIRSREWVRAIPWMFRCYPAEHRPALSEIARHMGAAFDDARVALDYIDASETPTPKDPYVILCELELAYRACDWDRALKLIGAGLGTIAAGAIDFRAFLLEQAVLVSEWGRRSDEKALTFLEDLWSLGPTVGSSPTFAVAAFLRICTRMKRQGELEKYTEFVRTNFTPSVAEALLAEPRLYEEAVNGEEAAQWYADRVDEVPAPLQPYYRWMAAVVGWLFGDRGRKSVQDLADAATQADPTHRVGPFLLAIAYRHADMYASCERQLAVLRTPGHSRPVQDWVIVRQLFHLAVTQNQPQAALELIEGDEGFQQFGWYTIARELFARATRDESAIGPLRERAKTSAAARSLRLEIAEIRDDTDSIVSLAADGLPEAVAKVEMLAARGNPAPRSRWDIEARHAEVVAALADEPADVARAKLFDFVVDVDEELLGSPWCPLRLVRGDLSRFEFSSEQVERIAERVGTFVDPEMSAEARLLVATEFLRRDRADDARRLLPKTRGSQLVYAAWHLFSFALDPYADWPNTSEWVLDFWQRRRRSATRFVADLDYEIGRQFEVMSDSASAIEALQRCLREVPTFLPAQVAAGRILIQNENWQELALLWESEMRSIEDDDALGRVAFRIGYLWERRLQELPDANMHAEEAFRRVLRARPGYVPALDALLRIAFRAGNWARAAQYLEMMVDAVDSVATRGAFLCELGAVREYHLEDPTGAREAYEAAFGLDLDDVDALHGLLRADAQCAGASDQVVGGSRVDADAPGEMSVAVLHRRLQFGVTQRELVDISHILFALTGRHASAASLMGEIAPHHYPWLMSRIVSAAERSELDREAVETLDREYPDVCTEFFVDAVRRIVGGDRPEGVVTDASELGTLPMAEGRVVRAMHHAWTANDLDAQGTLAAARARRANGEILRAAELTWVAATLMLRGRPVEALDICRQLLEQMPEFLPAVKVAKYSADAASRWEDVVVYFERDATLTRVSQVASTDRLYASEVQRKHLGDHDAALSQLRTVLAGEPTHAQAFGKMRDILLMRRQYKPLLDAYETRIGATQSDAERAELLNQMADIALNHLKERRTAIGFLSRSLELQPRQLKRLRVLSDLYEQEGRWDRAVVCHRAAADLVEDPVFLARLWNHVGELYEHRLEEDEQARIAYSKALKLAPEATQILVSLARVSEKLGRFEDAVALLTMVIESSRDESVLLDARIGIARLRNSMRASASEIIGALRDVLLHHPAHGPTINTARQAVARAGGPVELEAFFGKLTHDIIQGQGERGLEPAFEMSVHLKQSDRAFCIASVAVALDHASGRMRDYHHDRMTQRRWPGRALPPDVASALLPPGLVAPFMELLRRARDGVMEGFDGAPGLEYMRKGTRMKEPVNKATQLAFQWPSLMGLQLRDVYTAQGVPGGCTVFHDNGIRMILDEQWRSLKDPTDAVVALGRRLAPWSMGVGPWSFLDLDSQISLFIAMVSNYVRGWAQAERAHLPSYLVYPRVQRWMEKKGERVAPYAMELSGRFSTSAVRQQFEHLLVAQNRFATVLIDDPGRGLKAAGLLQRNEPGARPPWLFVLDTPAAEIRRAIGIAAD